MLSQLSPLYYLLSFKKEIFEAAKSKVSQPIFSDVGKNCKSNIFLVQKTWKTRWERYKNH